MNYFLVTPCQKITCIGFMSVGDINYLIILLISFIETQGKVTPTAFAD